MHGFHRKEDVSSQGESSAAVFTDLTSIVCEKTETKK